MIQAIETSYQGYKFRSRLEARWAVYFDTIGLKWVYEPEGYDLGEAGWYLPDFWLPDVRMWAEVKFDGGFDEDAKHRISGLVRQSERPCLLLEGVPSAKLYKAVFVPCGYRECCESGNPDCSFCVGHMAIAMHDAGSHIVLPCFGEEEEDWADAAIPFLKERRYGIARAVTAARGARFEHGESPAFVR